MRQLKFYLLFVELDLKEFVMRCSQKTEKEHKDYFFDLIKRGGTEERKSKEDLEDSAKQIHFTTIFIHSEKRRTRPTIIIGFFFCATYLING